MYCVLECGWTPSHLGIALLPAQNSPVYIIGQAMQLTSIPSIYKIHCVCQVPK